MNVAQCIEKKGMQIEVDELKRWNCVDIAFINSDGKEDETQFDVMFACSNSGQKELQELFSDFCKENGFSSNNVLSVTVVKSADTYEELEEENEKEM